MNATAVKRRTGYPPGQTWDEWRAGIWDWATRDAANQTPCDRGLNGLVAAEQYAMRSYAEKRCVECGDPATVGVGLNQCVPARRFYFCDPCAKHWEAKGQTNLVRLTP